MAPPLHPGLKKRLSISRPISVALCLPDGDRDIWSVDAGTQRTEQRKDVARNLYWPAGFVAKTGLLSRTQVMRFFWIFLLVGFTPILSAADSLPQIEVTNIRRPITTESTTRLPI